MNERDWERGNRAAWTRMLSECLRALGYENMEPSRSSWILEREAAVVVLREICEEHGDNDWPNDLHLADVIEKHLGRHLDK